MTRENKDHMPCYKQQLPLPLQLSLELSCSQTYRAGPRLPTPTIWSSLPLSGTEQQIAKLAKMFYKVKLKDFFYTQMLVVNCRWLVIFST